MTPDIKKGIPIPGRRIRSIDYFSLNKKPRKLISHGQTISCILSNKTAFLIWKLQDIPGV